VNENMKTKEEKKGKRFVKENIAITGKKRILFGEAANFK